MKTAQRGEESAALQHDELDGMLRLYFQAQMPKPWPAFRQPALVAKPNRSSSGLSWRSRLALAASVAILLVSQIWLARSFHDEHRPNVTEPGIDVAHPPRVPGESTQRRDASDAWNNSLKDMRLKNMR